MTKPLLPSPARPSSTETRRRAAALLIALGCYWLLAARAADSGPSPTAITLRVMTYNLHHGEGVDGKIDLARIAEVIKKETPDLVALQEVDKGVQRTAQRDFPSELAAFTGMTCIFSNNFHFQGGEYGNAILTRLPVQRSTNLHYRMVRPGEQRGLLQVVVNAHGKSVLFMNTHIDFRPDDTERVQNVEEIRTVSEANRELPQILCGDFNDRPGSRTHAKLKEAFVDSWDAVGQGDGFTIPSRNPRSRIDYIWVSKGSGLEPVKIWVPATEASDHLPLVAEIRLK